MSDSTITYTLIDGEQQNTKHPGTFKIPSAGDRASLTAGDIVKLGFEFPSKVNERMWVAVASRLPSGDYTGRLDNDPVNDDILRYGDEIRFSPRHVLAIWQD